MRGERAEARRRVYLSSSMDGEVVFGCYGVRAFGCGVPMRLHADVLEVP